MKADLHLADLFAGGGGFSVGVAEACEGLGRSHDALAVNHWEIAARTYKRNHPHARVLCTGLDAVLPTVEVPGGRLDLLAASPECTHHSNARGGRPMNDQSRSSAWLILKWLQELYVEAVLIENVQEFEDWGPLGASGRPLKSMRGALFQQFISSLRSLGYNVEWRILNAADYGGATTRERLFIMARRGRNKRIIWPDATHGPEGRPRWDRRKGDYTWAAKERWRSAREIIDWSIPSQSIFTRQRPLAPATIERIAAGLKKFGGKNAEPFVVVLRNHQGARSVDKPLPTLTTSGANCGLCQPFVIGQQSGATPRSVQQPLPTVATAGAISLVQPFVLSMEHRIEPFVTTVNHGSPHLSRNGQRVYDIENPMPTITTVDGWGVIEPFMVEYHGNHNERLDGSNRVRSLSDPLPTQTTENRFGLLEPLVVSYYGTQNVSTVNQPLPTVTTKDRFGLVQFGNGIYLDIHFRMLQWRELARAMGFPDWYEFEGNRGDKVKQIGNAVEVRTAAALAKAAVAA